MDLSWAPRDGGPTLADLGEEAALAAALPLMPAADRRILGPGDDAAVIAAPDGRYIVTSDTMIEGPDFRLAWTTPEDLGWKLVAVNLSDVAAMGARPTALTVALGLPTTAAGSVLIGIANGMRLACEVLAPGCGIEGGDLARSPIVLGAVTAFGDLEGRAPVLRSGARAGDVVAISGGLGQAARGLQLLFDRAVTGDEPDCAALARLREAADVSESAALAAQLRPHPPILDGPLAANAGATAMLDVSDGLALDAGRLARASGVAVELDGALLRDAARAAAPATARDEPDLDRILRGGEDHALLATFPAGASLPGGFRTVGRVTAGAGVRVDGIDFEGVGGWDPFRG